MSATDRPCEPDCQGYADYAAVPCPNPACDDRVKAAWERARQPEGHAVTVADGAV